MNSNAVTSYDGSHIWEKIHDIALNYDSSNPEETNQTIMKYIGSIECDLCHDEANAYIEQNPIMLKNSMALQQWAFTFHNAVNIRIGKEKMTPVKYQELYIKQRVNVSFDEYKQKFAAPHNKY
jgi:hypothetical protein